MLVLGKDELGEKEVRMEGSPIPIVNTARHLGNVVGRDSGVEQIQMSVQDLYKKFNQFFCKICHCKV